MKLQLLILADLETKETHKNEALFYLQAIESVKTAGDHKVVDLFVLFILHTHNYKKAVESLFRSKIRNGLFAENLLYTTITSHSQVNTVYV